MNKSVETYVTSLSNVAKGLKTVIEQIENDMAEENLTQGEMVDLGHRLYEVESSVKKFNTTLKKKMDFGTKDTVFGEFSKAKKTVSIIKEIPVAVLEKEIDRNHFLLCVKTIKANLKPFMTDTRVKELEIEVDTKNSIKYESIK